MNKLSLLCSYLSKLGYHSEQVYLKEIYAQNDPESFLSENFPKLFEIYKREKESGNRTPAPAYINIARQVGSKFELASEKDIDSYIESESVSSFSDLTSLLRQKKYEIKSESDDFLKSLSLPEERIHLLRDSGTTKEELSYILNEETRGNHSLDEAVTYLLGIKNNIDYIGSRGVRDIPAVNSFANLDEASDYFSDKVSELKGESLSSSNQEVEKRLKRYYNYIYHGIKEEGHDYSEYSNVVLGGAKENSKIIGQVGEYSIIFSDSKEAAQYWEKGCVSIENGKAKFPLCTSRIHEEGFRRENLYATYADNLMFQLIKNLSGEPKFRHEATSDYDLMTICFSYDSSSGEKEIEPMWNSYASVNSANDSLSESKFLSVFPSKEEGVRALELCKNFILSGDDLASKSVILKELSKLSTYPEMRFRGKDSICDVEESEISKIMSNVTSRFFFSKKLFKIPCLEKYEDKFLPNLDWRSFVEGKMFLEVEFFHLIPKFKEDIKRNITMQDFEKFELFRVPTYEDIAEKLMEGRHPAELSDKRGIFLNYPRLAYVLNSKKLLDEKTYPQKLKHLKSKDIAKRVFQSLRKTDAFDMLTEVKDEVLDVAFQDWIFRVRRGGAPSRIFHEILKAASPELGRKLIMDAEKQLGKPRGAGGGFIISTIIYDSRTETFDYLNTNYPEILKSLTRKHYFDDFVRDSRTDKLLFLQELYPVWANFPDIVKDLKENHTEILNRIRYLVDDPFLGEF